ncbi:FAD binding domain-containing protein [Actinomadura citrea]|jgi:xanthine dehydrogenase YagS FAD-binding subunit|uniref:Xanthine dehydrogenase YagS FAD-binding subunit n=1 Tax=Actinomadura citrea TaxID=46158 RepID=A0A7Y9GHF8_9ACTN|nr:xanthine dehydrogenase family protein subunit M [Actinomadura citrea]NYE16563.1 xanthine dehydrogenase YagS FAD-binding subunit [Actinomadura citrea]GGT56504.1 FAD-binding molybdopterin dehydrogenase [Actinomadura citrea]
MRPFAYERATSAEDALRRHQDGAVYLGGGTNLVDLMRLGVEEPARLVDVAHLPYDQIELRPDGSLVIGAAVTNSAVAADRTVREGHPVLAQAVLAGASGQVRNLATVGGNLLQRTRCSYFQDAAKPCNKRTPGSGCPAREGEHHNLAILGWSDACVATHPSDMAVALAALDASIRIRGRGGERTIPIEDLYRLPGDEPQRDTTLEPGDLVTAVEVPALGVPSRYRKVRERASFAFALVSIAAALDVGDGRVRDVRLALGGVAHKPWRARRAEEALRGAEATEESFLRAAEAELEAAEPLRDNAYKVPLARNLIVRTLTELGEES